MKRSLVVVCGFAALGGILWQVRWMCDFFAPDAHYQAAVTGSADRGTRFDFKQLAPDESIAVRKAFFGPRDDDSIRVYRLSGKRPEMFIYGGTLRCERGKIARVEETNLLGCCEVSCQEREGLAATVGVARSRRMPGGPHYTTYQIQYERGDQVVGEELLIVPHAFEKLSYSLLEGITPEADADFCQSLSAELGIQSAQIGKLMTFEVLEARMADQLPDPTPTSVTPAAGAPVAPPIGAGHS